MSTTFPLPLECLELIIRELAHQSDCNSLGALLRVNKHVCSATLPILYEGPLLLKVLITTYDTPIRTLGQRLRLMNTLLQVIPKTHVSDLLRAAYPEDPFEQEQLQQQELTASVPYHLFVTSASLTSPLDKELSGIHNMPSGALIEFVEQSGLEDQYRDEEPLAQFLTGLDILQVCVSRDLRRDLTWALCSNVERVKCLSISLTDIERYLPLVDRFKALSNVTFLVDRTLNDYNVGRDMLTSKQWEVLLRQREERIQHLDQMLFFVQEHRRLHRDVLRDADCRCLFPFVEPCPTHYERQLWHLLPPVPDLQFLNNENWERALARINDINLSAVKSIHLSSSHIRNMEFTQILRLTPFLHRCRSLQYIKLMSGDEDVFQWAVEERSQHDADIEAGYSTEQPLVPLQKVQIKFDGPFNGRFFDSIGYAFSDTLNVLQARCMSRNNPEPSDDVADCSFGGACSFDGGLSSPGWSTPQLHRLHIVSDFNFLRIHRRLLLGSPNLVHLTLMDGRTRYSTTDIAQWEVADLQHLKYLSLQGGPATSFHPGTLNNTPNLTYMSFYLPGGTSAVTPPLNDLEDIEYEFGGLWLSSSSNSGHSLRRQPIWTWDWELPKLTILKLNSVFARRFQFRMLAGTPSLQHLTVTIYDCFRLRRRTVFIDEFLKSTSHDQKRSMDDISAAQDDKAGNNGHNDSLVNSQLNYIHLPNLKDCALRGSWKMDKSVLEVLCSKVAPNTENLCLEGCSGFDMVDWVSVTSRNLAQLGQTFASVSITPEVVSAAGLVADEICTVHFRVIPTPGGQEGAGQGALYCVYDY
ncbi:hypothetical protein EC991_003283 [Linnemannia zychae]|nr:hypothetical protein EC991_003283 [Linnemannia zychae]